MYAVESYPKKRFPTKEVYGDTDERAELRLITYGGAFNEQIQHYVRNVVVYAQLTAVR